MITRACLALLVVAATSGRLPAAETAPADAGSTSLEFRRLYAPIELINDWPIGSARYLPLDTAEFERLLGAVQSGTAVPPESTVKLAQSEYRATWNDDGSLVGEATFEVIHSVNRPALLPLEPCNLAITSATWVSGKTGKATLGQGPDGKLGVLVERSGNLRLTWSLAGKRTSLGTTSFSIAVPTTPLGKLVVDVPPKWIAAADTGLLDLAAGAGTDKRDRWRIALGGRTRFNLRILSEEAATERRQFTLLRQALTYQFLPQGLDVTAQLRLDIHSEPVDRLVVDLDPTLELVSARYGETEVPWSAQPAGDKTRVTLLFREPLSGIGRIIRLSAIAPANLSKPWALPSLRPEGVLWQEGAATLLVPSPLVLERIDTHECRQARTSPLPAPLAGDSFEVQCYSPAAQIEVVVARPRDLFKATTRTSLGIGPSETIAQMDLELSINQGERFLVRADLHPKWQIKSVESDTADLVANWETPVEDGTRRLVVRLARAVSPSRQVRLRIAGRRPMKAAERLTLADVAMLSLEQTKVERQVIALGPAEGHELTFSGDEDLRLLESQELDQLPSSIFAGARPALAFAVDSGASALEVTASPVAPRFTADVQIDLAAQGKSLTESYLFRCTPGTQRLDRIAVQFSAESKQPLEWSLAGRATGRLTARRIVPKATGRAAPVGEEWEVALRSARNEPFEVRAVRTVPLKPDHRVALAALVGASRQSGTLTVRAIGETEVSVKTTALAVSPPELLAPDRQQTVRATYRFDPARDLTAEVSVSPALLQQYASGAWAWSAELTSLYAAGEAAIHTCRFRIQTGGRSSVRVTLPVGCQSRAIYVDSDRTRTADASRKIDVRLPSGRSVASVAVEFTSDETLPTYRRAVSSLFPRLDVPVLDRHWTVWLPAGFEVEDGDPRWLSHRSVEPSWKKRIFGPLTRSSSQRPFNPLRLANWQLPGQADVGAQGDVDRFLGSLRTALARPSGGDAGATWGRFLASIEPASGRAAPSWLIDRVGLAHAGIGPNTPLPALSADGDLASLMDDIGLVVIEHPKGLVLASSTTAACYHDQLIQLDAPLTYAVMPGPLKNDLTRVFERGGSAAFETAARWRLEPAPTLAAWPVVAGPTQGIDSRCWTAYHAGAAQGEPASMNIVRTSSWWTLAWALFFVGLAAGLSQGRRPLGWWVVSLATVAGVVLVVPASFTTLLSAFMLGLLCALGFQVVLRRRPDQAETSVSVPTLALPQPVATVVLLCVLIACAHELLAAEPFNRNPLLRSSEPAARSAADKPASAVAASAPALPRPAAEPAANPVYKVFVAVDDKQRPTGETYLPEEFFGELHRRAARLTRQPQRWLITAARYRGALTRESVQKKIALPELRASFDLQIVYPNARVRVPLGRRGLASTPQTVRLEGQPVRIEWEPAGDAFSLNVVEPGFYRLEIVLQPSIQAASAGSGLEIDIPRVSDSTLELTVPQDGPSLELPSSRGRRQYDSATGKLTANLGPTSRLTVRWQEGTRIVERSQVTEVEELLWLKVQPGSLVVDARFKLRASEGRLRRLRLLVDPRLRLLPSTTADPTVAAVHVASGDPQTLDVDLHPSMADPLVVNLSFLMSGTSGVGNVRPPRLESLDTRVTRRWVALSIDPSLQFAKQADAALRSVAAPDFAAAWGTAEAPPQIAYDVPRGELAWMLATQAPEAKTSVDQVLTLGVGRALADVRYQAAFETQAGYHLQLHIAAPPELEVDSIALSENGVQRVVRWSRQSAGPITVFLSAPVTGRQRLELRGQIGVGDGGHLDAPNIRLTGATLNSQMVKVFRRPAALVEVEPNETAQRTETPVDEQEKAEFGSFLGSFRLGADPLRLHVTPNAPVVDAIEVISLERKDEGWEAEVDVNLRSRQGVLDTLHFDIPPDWTEPLVASDQSVCHVISSPDLARRQLVVRPPAPIKDRYRVKIRGRILLPQGERLRVPDVTLRGANRLQRFIVLPLQLELQEVGWDISGLKPAKLPAGFRALPVSPEAFATYQVSAPRFEATLRPTESAPTGAHVLLADIAVSWRSDGHVYGMGAFDYVPGGTTTCDLLMPADYRLVHVSVAGLNGHARSVGQGRWRLKVASAELPQRIVAVFDGNLQGGGWRQRQARIALPQIVGVPTRRTLLSVGAPTLAGDGQIGEAAASSPQQHQVARLQVTVDALELAEQAARTLAPEEILRWRRPWLRRHSLLRQEVTRWLEAAAIPDQRLQDQLRALLDRGSTLGVDEANLLSGSASDPLPMELGRLPEAEVPGDTAAPCYASFEQGRASALVVYPSAARSDMAERLVGALAIVSIAVVGAVVVRGRSLPKISPRAALIVFGLLWWLFFEPSGAGLAAAALGIASWLLQNRKPGQQSSTIRRLRV